ncbi:MAG TPA: septal ring lytic transglycosylase RlpA family protein, partial [Terriglobia bacterium]|nr:septal ring lytic transglycosylase RlpA family protein [Terriglobia bacterium]
SPMPRHSRFELGAARAAVAATLLVSTGCLHRHRAAPIAQTSAPVQTYPAEAPSAQPIPGHPPPRLPAHAPATAPAVPMVQGEEGLASWYGHPFHGRSTSSGEIYNMYDITAAHKTLPFGTQVRVHDLDNGQSVDVRINDRGPFVEGRIIDLSYAAAQQLHLVGPGTALVWLEILNPGLVAGPAAIPGVFAVQVGAFRDRNNAERLRLKIESQFGPVIIQSFDRGDGLFHRVRVGRADSEDAARGLATRLQQAGLATETFVVRLN